MTTLDSKPISIHAHKCTQTHTHTFATDNSIIASFFRSRGGRKFSVCSVYLQRDIEYYLFFVIDEIRFVNDFNF